MNYIVSFPRSGQHLIESVLNYLSIEFNLDFSYCEYYNCCNKFDCPDGKMFQKNHDFWINPHNKDFNLEKIKIKKNNKYLVLYRSDLIRQLESYYRYYLNWSGCEYSYDEMLMFMKNNSDYYNNFLDKWVNIKKSNVLSVEYYQFVKNPNLYAKNIIEHFYNVSVDFDISDMEFSVKSGINMPGFGMRTSKIKLRNELDESLYNKIKSDLDL